METRKAAEEAIAKGREVIKENMNTDMKENLLASILFMIVLLCVVIFLHGNA